MMHDDIPMIVSEFFENDMPESAVDNVLNWLQLSNPITLQNILIDILLERKQHRQRLQSNSVVGKYLTEDGHE